MASRLSVHLGSPAVEKLHESVAQQGRPAGTPDGVNTNSIVEAVLNYVQKRVDKWCSEAKMGQRWNVPQTIDSSYLVPEYLRVGGKEVVAECFGFYRKLNLLPHLTATVGKKQGLLMTGDMAHAAWGVGNAAKDDKPPSLPGHLVTEQIQYAGHAYLQHRDNDNYAKAPAGGTIHCEKAECEAYGMMEPVDMDTVPMAEMRKGRMNAYVMNGYFRHLASSAAEPSEERGTDLDAHDFTLQIDDEAIKGAYQRLTGQQKE